ncbi:unnamed protein product [Gongylonema pulchrum]|uniref:FANCI_S4 domain-containing protein n=1 Tax=Gongylonema pulchrum TaxID=637853 RepID=A0A183DPI2_9BILA|nr:unnamed protein product [Gongylonema pulchrum]
MMPHAQSNAGDVDNDNDDNGDNNDAGGSGDDDKWKIVTKTARNTLRIIRKYGLEFRKMLLDWALVRSDKTPPEIHSQSNLLELVNYVARIEKKRRAKRSVTTNNKQKKIKNLKDSEVPFRS